MVENSQNFKIDTPYNNIEVKNCDGRLEFRSHGNALQSVIDLTNPHRLMLENLEYLVAVLLFIPRPERVLMLGTAAGSLLHFFKHHFPRSRITAVDIDAEMIEQLLQRKILPPAQSGLDYVYHDAARFIADCEQQYDLILVDIFTQAQSPAWLLHRRSADNLFRLLNADGALAYNLLIGSDHDFGRFYRTLGRAFNGQTLYLPVSGYENILAYAFRRTAPAPDISAYSLRATEMSTQLGIDLMRVLAEIYNTNPVGQGVI